MVEFGEERKGESVAQQAEPAVIRDRAVVVGLTGGTAAGKSTALHMFEELGSATFSADEYVHELYRRPDVKQALRSHFGPYIFGPDGEVDRKLLRQRVVKDRKDLIWLENFVNPQVAQERMRRMQTSPPGTVLVCEVPLLVEGGFQGRYDLVVTIEAPFGVRLQRSAGKFDEATMMGLERRRVTSGQRIAAADMHYINDAGIEELRYFVQSVYNRAKAMATGDSCRIGLDGSCG
jgi:dephospho-CoA kinase